MKTLSMSLAFFLFVNICFAQTQSISSISKNKMVIKFTNFQKENDAASVDRILSQCSNIYSSKTDYATGLCEIVADSNITMETINKKLSLVDQTAMLVSSIPMTKEELIKEGIIDKKNNITPKK